LDFGRTELVIQIGKIKYKNLENLITIINDSLISVSANENRLLLNATFEDNAKELI